GGGGGCRGVWADVGRRRPRRSSGGSVGGGGGDLGEPASIAARTVATATGRAGSPGAAISGTVHCRRRGRRAARARSAIALAAGLRDLSCSFSARYCAQYVHHAYEPLARHGADGRRERAARLSLPRPRSAGGVAAGRGGSGAVAGDRI